MSRTIRIYNRKKIKKAQQSKESGIEIRPGIFLILPGKSSLTGFPYHPYHQICMGRCSQCKNPNRDQKHLRKIRKIELNYILRLEEIKMA